MVSSVSGVSYDSGTMAHHYQCCEVALCAEFDQYKDVLVLVPSVALLEGLITN